MATDIVVPALGESVSEATVSQWLKKAGDSVAADEPLIELETDKVTLEVNAPQAGILSEMLVAEGDNVEAGALLGRIGEAGQATATPPAAAPAATEKKPPAAEVPAASPTPAPPTPAPPTPAPPTPAPANGDSGGTPQDILVPVLGESVSEATVAKWLKAPGDAVAADEAVVELETDKVTLEVNAPAAGVLGAIQAEEGAAVEVGAILGVLMVGAAAAGPAEAPTAAPASAPASAPAATPAAASATAAPAMAAPAPAASAAASLSPGAVPRTEGRITKADLVAFLQQSAVEHLGPAVRKMIADKGLDPAIIPATGPGGRLSKGDILDFIDGKVKPITAPAPSGSTAVPSAAAVATPAPAAEAAPREERVKMTKLRQTIARRLKEAQNTAAMLTTFNECDMSAVMALRAQYREGFEKKHGVRLGYSSFFTKAVVAALGEVPAVNARIDGDEIVYNKFFDIGMAVSTPNGLMVPVVRDCDKKSFAEIESSLGDLAGRGRDGKISMDEMSGGSFTITNGGVFGSLLSTPIINMPQSAILGLHKIQERPMAVAGEVVVRPMMYLALSYDHRIVDGREAVTFLVRVKENIEDPQRLLLDL